MKIYLAHSHNLKELGRTVEKKLRDLGFEVTNPFETGEHKEISDRWKNGEQTFEVSTKIVDMDLAEILKSDIVVSILDSYQTIGTICEIFFAYQHHIPVYALVFDKFTAAHPWIRTITADSIFNIEDSLIENLYHDIADV